MTSQQIFEISDLLIEMAEQTISDNPGEEDQSVLFQLTLAKIQRVTRTFHDFSQMRL